MALCDADDVAARLGGVTFTTSESAVVGDLIDAAQAHIERVAERAIEADDYTEVFDAPDNPNVWLANTPVNSLTSVTVDGTALATSGAYSYDPESGRLTRVVNGRPHSWGTYKVQSVSVVYNGGYETVPTDLADVCARIAARNYQAGKAAAETDGVAVKSVDIDGAGSVDYSDEAGDVSVSAFLTPDEVEAVRYYRNEYLV